jgi:hypothetical protein
MSGRWEGGVGGSFLRIIHSLRSRTLICVSNNFFCGLNVSYSFLKTGDFKPARTAGIRTAQEDESGGGSGKMLLCSMCGFPITSHDWRAEVVGSFRHTFANPSGFFFLIGCFGRAPGCFWRDEEYEDFSWFEGYTWAYAFCSKCNVHLGWRFRCESNDFVGLILDRLVEKDEFEQ